MDHYGIPKFWFPMPSDLPLVTDHWPLESKPSVLRVRHPSCAARVSSLDQGRQSSSLEMRTVLSFRSRAGSSRPVARRSFHYLNDHNIKQLIPTMQDLILKRNDTSRSVVSLLRALLTSVSVYMAMSGGVDSSVALRILADMVCPPSLQWLGFYHRY